jgi:hypothetical protein
MDGMHYTDACGKRNHEITPPYDGILILKPFVPDFATVIM